MSLSGLAGYGTPESESPFNTPSPRVTAPSAQTENKTSVKASRNSDPEKNIAECKAGDTGTKEVPVGGHDCESENTATMHEILNQLPDEPEGQIDSQLQAKIQQEIQRKNKSGVPFTLRLQKLKEFGNPYQLSMIVDFCKIDEWGSNYPKSKFDPKCDSKYYTGKLNFAPSALTRSTSSSSRSSRGSRGGSASQRRALLKRSSSSTDTTKPIISSKAIKKRKWDKAGAGMSSTTASASSDVKAIMAKTVAKKIEENILKKKKIL